MLRTLILLLTLINFSWCEINLPSVVEKVYPSTVNVYLVNKTVKYSMESENVDKDGKITKVFIPITKEDHKSIGSGVIVSEDGYIITNSHVVSAGNLFSIGTHDNRVFDVKVVYDYIERDLAILKIDDEDFKSFKKSQVATFGDSSEAELGESVLAIGTPLGVHHNTVQQGIISGKGKYLPDIRGRRYENLIQISAELNYGNSGGPLFNSNGEIIGINSAIDPNGRSIGFAVPGNIAKRAFEDYVKSKRVGITFVGIKGTTLNENLIKTLKMNSGIGMYVLKMVDGSPADKAGVKVGDVIQSVDGRDVKGKHGFEGIIQEFKEGTEVEIKVLRKGKLLDKKLKVSTVHKALDDCLDVYEVYNPPIEPMFHMMFGLEDLFKIK